MFNGIDFITIKRSPLVGSLTIHTRGASFSILIDGERSANDVLDAMSSVSMVIGEALGYHEEMIKQAEKEAREQREKFVRNKIIEAEYESTHEPPEGAPTEPHREEESL